MANLLYVDNSNVWIEGMHVAVARNGLAPDVQTAVQQKICDYNWNIDFGKLFQFAGGDRAEVKKAGLFGSRPPKNDSLWTPPQKRMALKSSSTTATLLDTKRRSTPTSWQR